MRKTLLTFPLAALLLADAQAAILVSNIDEPTRATTIIDAATWAAQSFYTAATPVLLNSIDVRIGLALDPSVVAELRADSGSDAPGALLATFSLSGLGAGAPQVQTLTPLAGDVPLLASQGYWLVLGAQGTGSYGFSYAEGNAMTGPGALGNYAYSSDLGATWTPVDATNPYHLRVNVTPVPEPASAWLLLAGTGVLGLAVRRRARRGA